MVEKMKEKKSYAYKIIPSLSPNNFVMGGGGGGGGGEWRGGLS